MSTPVNQPLATIPTVANLVLNVFPSTSSVVIYDGEKSVSLDWKKGILEVYGSGEMGESAKIFFEQFLKPYVDSYIQQATQYNNLKYLEWCVDQKQVP